MNYEMYFVSKRSLSEPKTQFKNYKTLSPLSCFSSTYDVHGKQWEIFHFTGKNTFYTESVVFVHYSHGLNYTTVGI